MQTYTNYSVAALPAGGLGISAPDGNSTGVAAIVGPGAVNINQPVLLTGGVATNPTAPSAPVLVSGTAFQNPNNYNCMFYQRIVAGAAGYYIAAFGPTNAVANALGTYNVASGADVMFDLLLPALWWIKLTLTTVTFSTAILIPV